MSIPVYDAVGDIPGTTPDGTVVGVRSPLPAVIDDASTGLDRTLSAAEIDDRIAAAVAAVGGLSMAAIPAAGFMGQPITGRYYDNSLHGAVGTLTGVAGQVNLAPFVPTRDITIDRLGLRCTTGVASALARACIYGSDANGWPDALLAVTGDLSVATSSTFVESTVSLAMTEGTVYWVGAQSSSTAALNSIPVAGAIPLGLGTSGNINTVLTVIRRVITFASGLPSSWTFSAAELTANVTPPSVRFRAA